MHAMIWIDPENKLKERRLELLKNIYEVHHKINFSPPVSHLKINNKFILPPQKPEPTKRKLLNDPSNKYHQVSVDPYNFETVLQQSIQTSGVSDPIIIINHQSDLDIPAEQEEAIKTINPDLNTENTEQNMDIVNIKDVPKLLKVLDNISKIYDAFQTQLPSNVN